MYLYRAVDSQGNTLDFHLSTPRDPQGAKQFFSKVLAASHTVAPRAITVDKNAASPTAFYERKVEEIIPASRTLRQSKYLNNLVEQDHRFIKRRVKPGLGFFSFKTAWRTLQGYEVMHMLRKGQIKDAGKGDILNQVALVSSLFGVAAETEQERAILSVASSPDFLQHNQNASEIGTGTCRTEYPRHAYEYLYSCR